MNRHSCKVQIGNCIKIIIISLIAFCTFIIPFTLQGDLVFTIKKLPILGDGSILGYQSSITTAFFSAIKFSSPILDYIFTYNIYALYGILLLNVFFSLILIIFRANFLRIIFKIFTIIFGIVLIFVALSYVAMVVAVIYCLFSGYFDLFDIVNSILSSGIVYYFVTMFFIFFIAKKQFGYFPKRIW